MLKLYDFIFRFLYIFSTLFKMFKITLNKYYFSNEIIYIISLNFKTSYTILSFCFMCLPCNPYLKPKYCRILIRLRPKYVWYRFIWIKARGGITIFHTANCMLSCHVWHLNITWSPIIQKKSLLKYLHKKIYSK